MAKFVGLLANANDFFEAAERCGWERIIDKLENIQTTRENSPLFIPQMVNMSFACELYLKAIAEDKCIVVDKVHELDKIFEKLPKEIKKEIFDIWCENAGENIVDCDCTRKMFFNNLEAVGNVFKRFRYANEWAGSTVSLSSSLTLEQFTKLSPLSIRSREDLLRPSIYDGFLRQFALSLRIYTEKID
ncbi:MAG: hypothetical protein LBR69_00455 [Endomicrobium sp.]|jgi:hypothetical protein|nr:hypothetical protein [Endomicrobium sp.]